MLQKPSYPGLQAPLSPGLVVIIFICGSNFKRKERVHQKKKEKSVIVCSFPRRWKVGGSFYFSVLLNNRRIYSFLGIIQVSIIPEERTLFMSPFY